MYVAHCRSRSCSPSPCLPVRRRPAGRGARAATTTARSTASVRCSVTHTGYVNAQYRFVMKPTYDCTAQIADADAPLPWADIEQVLVSATSDLPNAHSDTNCPICLSAPSAPRMTRCGHVFCYACILHYLIVAEDGARPRGVLSHRHSKRCPICWDEVNARDLKAVHWIDARRTAQTFTTSYLAAQHAESGQAAPGAPELTLRLIERPHGTAFALPRSTTWPAAARAEGIYSFQPDALVFSRVVLATPELLLASLERDVAEIDEEIVALRAYAPDELSVEFLRVAREKLGEQIAQVRVQLESPPLRRVQAARNAVEHAAQAAHAPPARAAQHGRPPRSAPQAARGARPRPSTAAQTASCARHG